jgi:hypothetical protein
LLGVYKDKGSGTKGKKRVARSLFGVNRIGRDRRIKQAGPEQKSRYAIPPILYEPSSISAEAGAV